MTGENQEPAATLESGMHQLSLLNSLIRPKSAMLGQNGSDSGKAEGRKHCSSPADRRSLPTIEVRYSNKTRRNQPTNSFEGQHADSSTHYIEQEIVHVEASETSKQLN